MTQELVVLHADEGHASVVMDRKEKIQLMLSDSSKYQKLNRDPLEWRV